MNPSSPAPQVQPPSPQSANPTNVCDDTILQIHADSETSSAQNKSVPLPNYAWLSVAWLKERLGQPKVKLVTRNLYQWDDYTLYGGDEGKIAVGHTPAGLASDNPTLADLTRVLGTPITNMSASLNKYTWNCPMKSTLKILTDKQDAIIMVSGDYCKNDNQCSFFALPGPVDCSWYGFF